jgi:hypothetical protein
LKITDKTAQCSLPLRENEQHTQNHQKQNTKPKTKARASNPKTPKAFAMSEGCKKKMMLVDEDENCSSTPILVQTSHNILVQTSQLCVMKAIAIVPHLTFQNF